LRTVNRIAKPFWASTQLFSNTLPSTRTRRAFLSSNRFLTVHRGPVAPSPRNVELLSGEYEEEAEKLVIERGLSERVDRRVADFVAEPVEPHDVVVMHRVVCCYPDVDRLVGIAAANTRRRLLFTYPRERPWTRAGIAAINFFMRVSGSEFRAFVHPVSRMAEAAQREGLALERREQPGLIWENAVYQRA